MKKVEIYYKDKIYKNYKDYGLSEFKEFSFGSKKIEIKEARNDIDILLDIKQRIDNKSLRIEEYRFNFKEEFYCTKRVFKKDDLSNNKLYYYIKSLVSDRNLFDVSYKNNFLEDIYIFILMNMREYKKEAFKIFLYGKEEGYLPYIGSNAINALLLLIHFYNNSDKYKNLLNKNNIKLFINKKDLRLNPDFIFKIIEEDNEFINYILDNKLETILASLSLYANIIDDKDYNAIKRYIKSNNINSRLKKESIISTIKLLGKLKEENKNISLEEVINNIIKSYFLLEGNEINIYNLFIDNEYIESYLKRTY